MCESHRTNHKSWLPNSCHSKSPEYITWHQLGREIQTVERLGNYWHWPCSLSAQNGQLWSLLRCWPASYLLNGCGVRDTKVLFVQFRRILSESLGDVSFYDEKKEQSCKRFLGNWKPLFFVTTSEKKNDFLLIETLRKAKLWPPGFDPWWPFL